MTPEQQNKIDEAAFHEYGRGVTSSTISKRIGFKAGTKYVLSHPELMRKELEEFMTWILNKKNVQHFSGIDAIENNWITEYLNSKTQQP